MLATSAIPPRLEAGGDHVEVQLKVGWSFVL